MTQELVDRCQALGLTYGFKDEYIASQNQSRAKPYPNKIADMSQKGIPIKP